MEDAYGLLLVAILATLVIVAALSETRAGGSVTILVITAVFFLAMLVSAVRRRTILIMTVIVPLVMALAAASASSGDELVIGGAVLAGALLVIGCISVIARRIAAHDRVSIQTVFAALCVYMLLAILFSVIYRVIGEFSGSPFFVQTEDPSGLDYIYFSFVCITTLGFGDLSPGSDLGKMAAIIEAVIGQLYLVTVVALFVSNLGRKRLGGLD